MNHRNIKVGKDLQDHQVQLSTHHHHAYYESEHRSEVCVADPFCP